MKIEAGKYYTTRDGRKARVMVEMPSNPFHGERQPYPMRGYVEGLGAEIQWTEEGLKIHPHAHATSNLDLVSEWKEPEKVVRWVHMWRDKDGVFVGNIHPRKMDHAEGDSPSELIARKRIEITEGTFDE